MADPRHILSNYNIGEVREIHPAGGTAGKCWRVVSAAGCYFLRLRGPRTSSRAALEFDHGLRRHLIARGVPTAAPIVTNANDTWVLEEGRAFELYPFVGGHAFKGSRSELTDTAHALARFHTAAADYPARGSYNPIPTQFAIAAPDIGGSDRFDDPGLMVAALGQFARAEPGFEYAVEQAGALAGSYGAALYDRLRRWLIHGDYHPGNLLYSMSGRVAGIFDLDWACEHTRSRDLADGIYYFATPREAFDNTSIESMTEATELNFDSAVLFVKTYAEHAPLDPDEVRAIPLALRARWLAERLEGSAKVPPERRAWFITRDLERPLQWLDAHGDEFVRAVLRSSSSRRFTVGTVRHSR
jgi:Ser/Thr protein kinase RdoA (MazF antagonist)